MRGERSSGNSNGIVQASLDILRFLKSKHDYRTISSMTRISPSTLSRYVSGKTLPRYKNALKIVQSCKDVINPSQIIKEYVNPTHETESLVNLSHDISAIKLIATHALSEFLGVRANAAFALDVAALPIATYFASITNLRLYFASEKPLWQDGGYVEVSYRVEGLGGKERVWLPLQSLSKGNATIIFASRMLAFSPLRELVKTYERYKSNVVGIYVLIASKKVWENFTTTPGCKRVAALIV